MSVDIANESGVSVDEAALAALAGHVLAELRIHPLAELSVLLVDEPAMADLHQRWMGEPGPADVLAFPMDELRPPSPPQLSGARGDRAGQEGAEPSPALLGDVVLCPQVAAAQAKEAGHGTAEELELLCAHGLLHLLGYDHGDPGERATMFSLQDKLLASWRAARGRSATAQAAEGSQAAQAAQAAEGSQAAQAAQAAEGSQAAQAAQGGEGPG